MRLFINSISIGMLILANTAIAVEERIVHVKNDMYRAFAVLPQKVTLHWQDSAKQPYRYMQALQQSLSAQDMAPVVMMNAGIYDTNYNPAGLHIEQGKVLKKLNTKKGSGNFHLQPNGVFLITKNNEPRILTTSAYKKYYSAKQSRIRIASQSGPLLVIDGAINQRFIKKSQSRYIRNAVCTTPRNTLYFVISEQSVSFYNFATALTKLGCNNALYLDGSISKLYHSKTDSVFHLRPFVGMFAVSP